MASSEIESKEVSKEQNRAIMLLTGVREGSLFNP